MKNVKWNKVNSESSGPETEIIKRSAREDLKEEQKISWDDIQMLKRVCWETLKINDTISSCSIKWISKKTLIDKSRNLYELEFHDLTLHFKAKGWVFEFK